jgi:hypothetical protein
MSQMKSSASAGTVTPTTAGIQAVAIGASTVGA